MGKLRWNLTLKLFKGNSKDLYNKNVSLSSISSLFRFLMIVNIIYSIFKTIQFIVAISNDTSDFNFRLRSLLKSYANSVFILILFFIWKKYPKRAYLIRVPLRLAGIAFPSIIFENDFTRFFHDDIPTASILSYAFFLGYCFSLYYFRLVRYIGGWRTHCLMILINFIHMAIRLALVTRSWVLVSLSIVLFLTWLLFYLDERTLRYLISNVLEEKANNKNWKFLVKKNLDVPILILNKDLLPTFYNKRFRSIFKFPAIPKTQENDQQKQLILNLLQNIVISSPSIEKKDSCVNGSLTDISSSTEVVRLSQVNSSQPTLFHFLQEGNVDHCSRIKIPEAVCTQGDQKRDVQIQLSMICWKGEQQYLMVFQDISVQKLNTKLQELNISKDNLLAAVSHDLRSPLNGVLGMVQASLSDRTCSQEISKKLKIALDSGNFLAVMINDILDFTLIQNHKLKLIESWNQIEDVINESLNLVRLQAETKGLKLLSEIAEDVPRQVYADANRLKQILMNLLTNAIKFTKKGWIKVAVEKHYHESIPFLRLSVQDTGIGIKSFELGKLFKMFGKLEQDDPLLNQAGIGLGLKNCQDLLEIMNTYSNNHFEVQSVVDEGTVFSFSIPLKLELENESFNSTAELIPFERNLTTIPMEHEVTPRAGWIREGSPYLVKQKSFVPTQTIQQRTVLAVDDNAYNLYVLDSILGEEYKVIKATSGKEAIDILLGGKNTIDVILMDCYMPEMDGKEATKIIRKAMEEEKIPKIPIIACTGAITEGDREDCLRAGMDDIVVKPISKPLLERLLKLNLQKYTH